MIRHPLPLFAVLAALGGLVVAGVADAQQPAAPKKLYRWVDKDGKVQFSDSLPPEAIDQARTELSSQSGRVVADVGRALTAEEQAAVDAAAVAEAERAAEAERTRKTEEAMLASFETEADLERSVQERIGLLNETLNSIEAGISSQRDSLSTLLQLASETELRGAAVPQKQVDTIRQLHREISHQQQMLVLKRTELVDADRELEHMLRRYRELKASRGGGPVAPATDAAPTEPTTGESGESAPAADAPAEDAPTG